MVEAMEIKEGFKQTEVGVIPSDWDAKPLGAVLKVRHGKSQKEVADTNGEYPILASGGVIGKANRYLYNKPSVLIGRKGTIDKPQFVTKPFWSVDTLFYTEVFENYSPEFLYYNFLLIDWYAYNEASGVPSLNAKTIEQIPIPFPPTKAEQTAIATALNDADALITQLEKLIAKKRAIKQGAMQELLKPKDGWDIIPVSKYGEVKRGAGSQYINYVKNNGIRLIRINDFFEDDPVYVNPTKDIMRFAITENDVLFAGTGASAGASYIPKKEWIGFPHSYNAPRIRTNDNHLKDYLLHALQSEYITKQQRAWFVGAAQPFLDLNAISNLLIATPPTKGEETKIARILSDMDTEIEALEKKFEKHKMLKQGMMQNLLTGRIRLV